MRRREAKLRAYLSEELFTTPPLFEEKGEERGEEREKRGEKRRGEGGEVAADKRRAASPPLSEGQGAATSAHISATSARISGHISGPLESTSAHISGNFESRTSSLSSLDSQLMISASEISA